MNASIRSRPEYSGFSFVKWICMGPASTGRKRMTASVVRHRPDEMYAGSPAGARPAGNGAGNACRLLSTLDGFARETKFTACVVPTRISSDQRGIRHRFGDRRQ
ncbi:hypothetical protein BCEP27_50340 [Burkholderia cepacia]